jgi:carbon monoxide dehydrogenase subunit G
VARLVRAWVFAVVLAAAGSPAARAAGDDAAGFNAALIAALPVDGSTDLMVIAQPSAPDAPRAWGATRVAATPAAIKDVLLDPARYRALIPALVKSELGRSNGGAPVVDWELEIPLFNLSGRMALHNRPDGVTIELFEGDFAPGRLSFTVAPDARGGSTLIVDAVLDVKRSTWMLRRMLKRSPVGEPAALTAAAYVAMRAVALRAEHPRAREAWRPHAPVVAPADWLPDPRPLASDLLAPLRAGGVVALVARTRADHLAGVAAAVGLTAPPPAAAATLRSPASWRAFPGWEKITVRPGPNGPGADVKDNLPLVDFDASWTAEPGAAPRWVATAGDTRGARLAWDVYPSSSGGGSIAALTLFPRLEATGSIARRFIAAEPLLEQGLSLALAFVDVAAIKAALRTPR